jgi:hypothetical protein
MTVKRALAGLLVFLFIIVALPTFLFFGISNSFLRQSFYEGPVADITYNFAVNVTAADLLKKDDIIAAFFNETDLKAEMMIVFPESMFKGIMTDLSGQIASLKDKPDKPLTISLKVFRESLLTFANDLSYKLFQKLPVCVGGQLSQVDVKGLPTCIPPGAEYNQIAAPFAQRFESTVYSIVPEQIQVDLNSPLGQSGLSIAVFLQWFMYSKYILYGSLLLILILIVLLIYSPFSLIVKYEGMAFAFSGITGYLLSLGISMMPDLLISDMNVMSNKEQWRQLISYLASYVAAESQKIALAFLALGAVLILIRVFLTHRYNSEKDV